MAPERAAVYLAERQGVPLSGVLLADGLLRDLIAKRDVAAPPDVPSIDARIARLAPLHDLFCTWFQEDHGFPFDREEYLEACYRRASSGRFGIREARAAVEERRRQDDAAFDAAVEREREDYRRITPIWGLDP